jgi:hypothetical protein
MRTPEEKAEMLRQQLSAKLIWGARDCEVLDWLEEHYGIIGAGAEHLLAEAHRTKRAAVRGKAWVYLFCSLPGMLLAALFVAFQSMGRFVIIGYGSVLILALGFVSLGVFIRSIFRLITGYTDGSVN